MAAGLEAWLLDAGPAERDPAQVGQSATAYRRHVARRIPVADKAVLHLPASLREAELIDTAELVEAAYDREARIVALDIPDREAILRVLEDCPEEMLELRATLLHEHVWRQRERL
jgi:hypothetical protein